MDKNELANKIDNFELELKKLTLLIAALSQLQPDYYVGDSLQDSLTIQAALNSLETQSHLLEATYQVIRCEIFANAFGS